MSQPPLEGSPDAPEPVTPDLLGDLDEADMRDLAIEAIQAKAPEWTPRAGSQEVVFIEAMAMLLTSLNFSISQVPGMLLEHLMRMYGVERGAGGPARAVVRFEVAGSQSVYEIPAGTTLRAQLESTGESVDFTTDGRLEILADDGSGMVWVTATEPGDQFNGLPQGLSLDLVDNLPFVERVTLDTATTGGRGEETDASFQARAAALLGRQVSTLVLPDHFRMAALESADVGRAHVLDLYDPTATDGAPGDHIGHITVVVADTDGQPLAEGQKTELADSITGQALASLVVHVVDPDYTDVDISVTVRAHSSSSVEQVRTAVVQRLTRWLSPARWDWGGEITQFALVAEVAAVPGVAEVITAPDGYTLDGVAPLPRVGGINVTVVGQ